MKTPRKEIARALRYMQDYKIKKEVDDHGIQKIQQSIRNKN